MVWSNGVPGRNDPIPGLMESDSIVRVAVGKVVE